MNKRPSSILIVKASAIGDVIQSFPAAGYLRQRFPTARIDWLIEEGIAPLLRAHPQLDEIIDVPIKAWRKAPFSRATRSEVGSFVKRLRSKCYDLLFDLQGNTKSALLTAVAKAHVKVGFDRKSVREKSNLIATTHRIDVSPFTNVREKYLNLVKGYFDDREPFSAEGVRLKLLFEEQERLQAMCQAFAPGPRLMVCFGSKWPNKRFNLSMLSSLLTRIKEEWDPFFLFIFGDSEEKSTADAFASQFKERSIAIGDLSLPLWQGLMWEVDGVLAVDSAALHLCATTQTPSFSVFGPSSSAYYKPLEERHASFQGACPYDKQFFTRCPLLRTCQTGACTQEMSLEDLFPSFQRWASLCLQVPARG